ncbi:hypothetical protein ABKN59_001017 [Abortiporus biennis]
MLIDISQCRIYFECSSPNFTISSIPDGTKFKVDREILIQRSAVFCDMFSCCDSQDSDVLELTETSSTLNILFNFLHHPPPPFPTGSKPKGDFTRIKAVYPDSTIPFPLLPQLLRLADNLWVRSGTGTRRSGFKDKYVPTGSTSISIYIRGDQSDTYCRGISQTCSSPTVQGQETGKEVLSTKIQPATDVAGEMGTISQELGNCETCLKACTAAVSMLAYKCAKVPRTIDKLPTES